MTRRLADESWVRVTVDHVHLAYLSAELSLQLDIDDAERALVAGPDLSNPDQNDRRRDLLYRWRRPVLAPIPPSTEWYDVRFLEEAHLDQLLVIGRCQWDDPSHRNELVEVARRHPSSLTEDTANWSPPILWGHTRGGPFTILEGNHRLLGYASAPSRPPLSLRVLVGLSPDYCLWHLPDSPRSRVSFKADQ